MEGEGGDGEILSAGNAPICHGDHSRLMEVLYHSIAGL